MTIYSNEFKPLNSNVMANQPLTGIMLADLAKQKISMLETRRSYGSYLRIKEIWLTNIEPYIENKDIALYKLSDVDDMVLRMKKDGKSNKTINNAVNRLNMFFNFAIKKEYVSYNPARNFEWLPTVYEEMNIITWQEFELAMNYEKDYTFKCLFNTLFWAAMRIGEAKVLTWKDVDLIIGSGKIRIEKHLCQNGTVINGRKNIARNNRNTVMTKYTVGIDDELVQMLIDLKRLAQLSEDFLETDFIFGGKKVLPPQTIRNHLNYDLERAKLKHIRVHDLRHSAVSYLFNYTNLTVQQIASRIGDTVDVVLKTYAHFYKNNDEIVTNAIKASKANRKEVL